MSHIWLFSGLLGLCAALFVWRIGHVRDRNPNADLLIRFYQQSCLRLSKEHQLEK
jgi:hypothetical protein